MTNPVNTGLAPSSAENDLWYFRDQYPWLPILPPPVNVIAVYLAANTERVVRVPDGSIVAMFRGNMDYYLALNAPAVIPTGANTADNANQSQRPTVSFGPEGYAYYVGQTQMLSIISPFDGCVVTIAFWSKQVAAVNNGL